MRKARLRPCFNLFILLLMIAGFTVLEFLYHHGIFRFLIYFFLLLLIISVLWAFSLSRGIQCRLKVNQQWTQSGELLILGYELCQNGFFPALWLELQDLSAFAGPSLTIIKGINSKEQRRWKREFRCQGRGVYQLGPLRLHTKDFFSFFSIDIICQETDTLLLLPSEPRLDHPFFFRRERRKRRGAFKQKDGLWCYF